MLVVSCLSGLLAPDRYSFFFLVWNIALAIFIFDEMSMAGNRALFIPAIIRCYIIIYPSNGVILSPLLHKRYAGGYEPCGCEVSGHQLQNIIRTKRKRRLGDGISMQDKAHEC